MPGRAGRFFGRLADAFIPGNAYNSTRGTWNPATTKVGIAGLIADQLVPGGSNIVGMAANGGLFGNGISSGLQRENTYNAISDQFRDTREGLADYLHNQQVDVGSNPQVSVGQPQLASVGSFAPSVPTMPAVQSQAPWQSLGTSTGNVFGGGSLGNWASGNAQPQGHSFGQAAGSFTPFGAGVIQNDYWGDAAAGFGIGATSGGSSGSYALADAMRANKKNRD